MKQIKQPNRSLERLDNILNTIIFIILSNQTDFLFWREIHF